MITQYHRPQTLEEALKLLSHADARPMGGGTILSQRSDESFTVVDLQSLGLNKLNKSGNKLEIGATVTLQNLLEYSYATKGLKEALKLETPLNLRNMGTVAGTLVTCDGRSPFGTVMLALDAKMTVEPGTEQINLGDYLPLRVGAPGKLITKIEIPLNIELSFETVARTPADKPLVCVALVQWSSGRTRLALGGWGQVPILAMDGNDASGIQVAARNAASVAGDEWASAEYRMDVAGTLAKRCLDGIGSR